MRGSFAMACLLLLGVLAGCTTPHNASSDPATTRGGFTSTAVFAGKYATDAQIALPLAKGPYRILSPTIEHLQSSVDGATIEIALVRPAVPDGVQVPVILVNSPYYPVFTPANIVTDSEYERNSIYVPHGFALALAATRGTGGSGGCMVLTGDAERRDIDQTLTWLGTQPWSNGNVGMTGISYVGTTPWEAAATANPHLKTIVPMDGINDYFQLMYHNGTDEFQGYAAGDVLNYWSSSQPTAAGPAMVCPEVLQGEVASMYAASQGERDPLGYWAERNNRPAIETSYKGSILLSEGLTDWNVDPHHQWPWVSELADRGVAVKQMIGQWPHAYPDSSTTSKTLMRWDWAEIQLHWFQYWLQGNTSVDLGPRVQVQDANLQWRNEDAWPPKDTAPLRMFLGSDDTLAPDGTTPDGQAPLVPAAPNPGVSPYPYYDGVVACPGCPTYTSEPFANQTRLAGLPRVHVTVTPAGPGGHVAAYLYLLQEGEAKRLGWGQMDLRMAAGGEDAQQVTPGQPLLLRMQLEPLDAVIPKGAKLQLVLHQGSVSDHYPSAPTYPIVVDDGGQQSFLEIDTFQRGDDVLFKPPAK